MSLVGYRDWGSSHVKDEVGQARIEHEALPGPLCTVLDWFGGGLGDLPNDVAQRRN